MSLYSDLNEVLTPYAQKIKDKADKSTTYTKTEVDDLISGVDVETDTTLIVPGAPADAAETGRQIGLLKADLVANFKSIVGVNNLFNSATWTAGNISASGEIGSTPGFHYSSLIPVTAGTYTFMWTSPASMGTIRVHGYDSEGAWVQQITNFSSGSGNTDGTSKITVGSDISYVRFSLATGNTNLVFIKGDAIQEKFDVIEEDLNDLADKVRSTYSNSNSVSMWSQGSIVTADGSDVIALHRIRLSGYLPKMVFGFTIASGFKYMILAYNSTNGSYEGTWNGTAFVKTGTWLTADIRVSELGDYDFRVIVAKTDDSRLTPEEGYVGIGFLMVTDTTFSQFGKPADAYESGVKFDALGKVADSFLTMTLDGIKSINTSGTWSGNVYTMNGVTFTVGDDFSVVVNGTASAAATLRLYSATLTEDIKVIAINPSVNASDDVYVCRMASNGAIEKYSKGTSERVLPTGLQRVMIRIESGKSASNLIVKRPYLLTGTLTDFALTNEVTDEFKNIVNYIPYQRYSYTGNISTPSELKTTYSANNLLEAIYAFCDELMATYPNFVTKETLSYTGDIVSSVSNLPDASTIANGTIYMVEVEGGYHQYICNNGAWVQMHTWNDNEEPLYLVKLTYPMYAYTISPYSGCNYPVIVWCSGLHGSEDWSNVSTLYLFKELLANRGQNDDIDYLLSNFVIKIVPCCGVSACADRTLGAHAMSENGVNPNRDFPVYWEMSANEWHRTGNVPWYDPYNRILKSYLEGLSNVVYCVNKHDSNTLTSDAFVNNVWDNYISANLVEDRIFKQLDLTIKAKYPWLLSEFVGTGVTWTPNSRSLCRAQYVYGTHGSFEQWYNSIGIKGGLIETVCKTGTAYSDAGHDADFYRIALECDVMTLCAIAKNIKTLSISDELNTKFS